MSKQWRHLIGELGRAARRAGRLLYRDPGRALLVWRMAGWVIVLVPVIKLLSLPRTVQLLTPRRRPATAKPQISQLELAQTLDQLLQLNLFVFTPICWKRALILYRYLLLNGIEARVVFGMRRSALGRDELAGHAWVEVSGCPVQEAEPPDFAVTYSYPR